MILSLSQALTRYAKANRPDLLWQITKFPAHGFATTVAGQRANVPVLTRFAGDNFREHTLSESPGEKLRTYALNNVLGRVAVRNSDATIVLGPYGRKQILSYGGTRTYEIPQPVNRDRFRPASGESRADIRAKLGLPQTERLLLTVGRVSQRKGANDLMKAARTLLRRGSSISWCIVGDGPLRHRLNSLPNVTAVGRVPHSEMPQYYQSADLVVCPSHLEGLPNVLLEAAACGTPTLARDVGDCALAASMTYENSDRLPILVKQEYEPVDLNNQFDPERLRDAYSEALLKTAATGDW
ncbi:glycosyltransferase [Natronosalvus caseinilyticus]|uniref:glycosyltransferase n=1 Tax=Natronosalvus caseinilyticus TaxID=2953747 RepID=UPI003CCE3104